MNQKNRNLNYIYSEEWSVLKDLVQDNIDELDKKLARSVAVCLPDSDGMIQEDDEEKNRHFGEDRQLRNFLIVLKEKMDYIKEPIEILGIHNP